MEQKRNKKDKLRTHVSISIEDRRFSYMGGVLVAEMSSSFSRISSLCLGYSSNLSARPKAKQRTQVYNRVGDRRKKEQIRHYTDINQNIYLHLGWSSEVCGLCPQSVGSNHCEDWDSECPVRQNVTIYMRYTSLQTQQSVFNCTFRKVLESLYTSSYGPLSSWCWVSTSSCKTTQKIQDQLSPDFKYAK